MKKIITLTRLSFASLFIAICAFNYQAIGQLTTYDWPNGDGEALVSDKFSVFVKTGINGSEQQLEVLMSNAITTGDFRAVELTGRTFSFVNLAYNPNNDSLFFRVVKDFGNPSASVRISPKSYGIQSELDAGGKEVTFMVNTHNKYISVDFTGTDNRTSPNSWIKHMLVISIDPLETGAPEKTGTGVVEYSNSVDATTLQNASIIYFAAGYHNMKNYENVGIIDAEGILTLQNGQKAYLEGGAFVEGLIDRADYNDSGQKVYGRGILSGRQYLKNELLGQIINLGTNATIDGVMVMESPHHGIVGRKVEIKNLKFLGWHANNDGVRVGSGSEIYNSFMRCVDDHFYNFDIHVHDMVLWAGHNGSIMTYGWGSYDAGSSLMENVDIINPEWIGIGNNNGLIMSQVQHDFIPKDYGNDLKTVMRNIRIEGSIPGLVNLKPRTGGDKVIIAEKVAFNNVGYVGELLLENIQIESQFEKGYIFGSPNASLDKKKPFLIKNVEFNNITVGSDTVKINNWRTYFSIDTTTIENIRFNDEMVVANVDYGSVAKHTIKVEAEDYTSMEGIQSETTSDAGGGLNIGFIHNGDWTAYTVTVPEDGTYEFSARAASGSAGGDIVVSIDNNVVETVTVDNEQTNEWQDWYTTAPVEMELEEGDIDLKLEFTGGSGFLFNLNWVQFVLFENTSVSTTHSEPLAYVYPNPASDYLKVKSVHQIESVVIFDIQGKQITHRTAGENIIDISDLTPGIYIVQIQTSQHTISQKILKQ